MSHYHHLAQSPHAQPKVQSDEFVQNILRPSSPSYRDHTMEQWAICDQRDPRPLDETLAPQRPAIGTGLPTRKQDGSSHSHSLRAPHAYTEPDPAYASTLPAHRQGWHGTKRRLDDKARRFWTLNRSYLLVIISTFFGSLMTLLTKLLESEEHGMHAFRILWCRMTVSWAVCVASLYFTRRDEFPLGPRKVRWLLVARGVFGFFGIGGLWTALNYLNLSDATVITFLTPSLIAGYAAVFLHEPFSRKEMAASFAALLGVVFIARPIFLFGPAAPAISNMMPPSMAAGVGDAPPLPAPILGEDGVVDDFNGDDDDDDESKRASERLFGISLCIVSAIGAAGALLSVKRIGTRASVLTTTSYFALLCTLVTTTALLLGPRLDIGQPQLHFALPRGATQWLLVGAITLCGLATQLLLTLGVGGEGRSTKAPAMLYTGMLWSAGFDRLVLGKDMQWTSVLGCGLIVGGAVFIALQPKPQAAQLLPVAVTADAGDDGVGDEALELDRRA